MIPVYTNREAVITGCGVVNSVSNCFAEFQEALIKGSSGVRPIQSFLPEGLRNPNACEAIYFDEEAVKAKHGARRMDRSSSLVLATLQEATQAAGLDWASVDPMRGAVLSGSTLGGARTGVRYYRDHRNGHRRVADLKDYSIHSAGYRVCIHIGTLGPNLVFSTACTSSNLAIASALDLIRANKVDVVVVSGFDPMSEVSCAGFTVMRNVSPDLCRPFDKNRKGLVLGEGAATLIIEGADFAAKRNAPVLAKVRGHGLTSDAHHMTAPDVTAQGPKRAMQMALEMAGATETQVDFVCTHGTGTIHNDAIEAKAIHGLLGSAAGDVPCSSIKSMVGHTLGAAGTMNVAAILAAGRGNFIPPTLNFEEPDTQNPLAISAIPRPAKPSLVLSNTLGFGGSNCSICIELG
ncbi:beta-ketoacyl-[acyl-carrier-protein] synthase family protein [Polycladidibacter stylochi]|uniref:beta-ketoacyl-[acyl-carrier-protein] synthase family protein n=1 Tax=Polycladidibacter stylochi TaxID=1807766 RepID=UPI0008376155|nr:beta-ketoacyl-[acyl-carrier-protein] synthase family protein [Pseudovibrio stylochi]